MNTQLLLSSWLMLSAAPDTPAVKAKETALFGLVIGTNVSRDPSTPPLRFADDDAVKNAELLWDLGADVVLLVAPDAETRELHPGVEDLLPTAEAVRGAWGDLNKRVAAAKAEGRETTLYVFYSGHGDVENNEGYVNLEDTRLWRRDLVRLLAGAQADAVHVVIDACKSYFLAFARGPGGRRQVVTHHFAGVSDDIPDNVGLLLSTSSAQDSHEWEKFQAGIFSHEVRSALRGAADQDEDGRITYEEVAAFVWNANRYVPNVRFRPQVFPRPPVGTPASQAVLVNAHERFVDAMTLGPGIESHVYVEDEKGVRLLDVHPRADQTLVLGIPPRRPLYVRADRAPREAALISRMGRTQIRGLAPRASEITRRGAEHRAFTHLFGNPFDPEAVVDYHAARTAWEATYEIEADWTPYRRALGVTSLGLLVLGGGLTGAAAVVRESIDGNTPGADAQARSRRIDTLNAAAVASYVLGVIAGGGYLGWTAYEAATRVEVLPGDEPYVGFSWQF